MIRKRIHWLITILALLHCAPLLKAQVVKTYFKQSKETVKKEFEGTISGKDTIKNGSFKHFFEYSGAIYEEGSFKENKKHGLFITYYENGKKHWVRSYKEGLLFGNEEYYNLNEKLLFSGLYTTNLEEQTTAYEQFYEDGRHKRKINLINNKYNGADIEFYLSGDTSSIKHFEMGVLQGPFKIFNEQGILWQSGTYLNGKLTDLLYTYYPKGTIKSESNFKNGALNGKHYDYHSTGQVKRDCYYKNDKLEGSCLTYYQNGLLASKAHFLEGRKDKLYLEYFKNGTLKDSINYLNGQKENKSVHYAENGVLLSLENFKNGIYDGHLLSYYPNGVLKKDFNYRMGKKIGQNYSYHKNGEVSSILIFDDKNHVKEEKQFFENGRLAVENKHKYKSEKNLDGKETVAHYVKSVEWHINGAKKKKGTLKNGAKHDQWIMYYETKTKKTLSNYKYGKLNGAFKLYYKNKQIHETGTYVSNKKTGTWYYYREDGTLQLESNYKKGMLHGSFTEKLDNGYVISGNYVNGQKNGTWVTTSSGNNISSEKYKRGVLEK